MKLFQVIISGFSTIHLFLAHFASATFAHFSLLVDTNLPYLDLQQIYVRRLGWLLSLPYMILSGLNSICKQYKNTNTYFSLYLQIHKCSDGILGYQSIKMLQSGAGAGKTLVAGGCDRDATTSVSSILHHLHVTRGGGAPGHMQISSRWHPPLIEA